MSRLRNAALALSAALAWGAIPNAVQGQGAEPAGAVTDEMFDFLLGEWTYSFEGGGGSVMYEWVEASQTIRETLDGHLNGQHFSAASLIYYSEADGEWQQRWVDSFGFVILSRADWFNAPDYDGPVIASTFTVGEAHFRHVWFDIEPDRFNTDLYVSSDGGETYTLTRRAPYERSGVGESGAGPSFNRPDGA